MLCQRRADAFALLFSSDEVPVVHASIVDFVDTRKEHDDDMLRN